MDLSKILLTGLFFLFFLVFLVFLEFLDSWAWDSKNLEKNQINQKNQKKTIWNRLTPDSSHRIVFFVSFWFSLTFWTYGKVEMKKGKKHEKTKDAKTQRSQRPFLFTKDLPRLYGHNHPEPKDLPYIKKTPPEVSQQKPLKNGSGQFIYKSLTSIFRPFWGSPFRYKKTPPFIWCPDSNQRLKGR